jgi:hypothetical protein
MNQPIPFILDPFETQNMESTLTPLEKSFLHDTLQHMMGCKGKNCILPRKNHLQVGQQTEETSNNINSIPFRGSRRRHGEFAWEKRMRDREVVRRPMKLLKGMSLQQEFL